MLEDIALKALHQEAPQLAVQPPLCITAAAALSCSAILRGTGLHIRGCMFQLCAPFLIRQHKTRGILCAAVAAAIVPFRLGSNVFNGE